MRALGIGIIKTHSCHDKVTAQDVPDLESQAWGKMLEDQKKIKMLGQFLVKLFQVSFDILEPNSVCKWGWQIE